MPKLNPICRVCGAKLSDENWLPFHQKGNRRICKECERERQRRWYQANPEKAKAIYTKAKRKRGARPYSENKECGLYLGVHIAERVLSHVFQDIKRMPYGNPGYDFICNQGKWIDVKSACLSGKYPCWLFIINRNTTADYFLCLAFNNREELTPLHVWLIPGNVVNHLRSTSISPSTVSRWDEYQLDISKINDCCVTMREK